VSATNSSVDQVFDMLSVLSARTEPIGVAELARTLDVPTSTAHRIVITLLEAGYASRDASGTKYQLGLGAQELAHALLGRFPVAVASQPVLTELAADTGSTALLVCRVGWYALRLAGAEGWREIHAAPRLGQTSLLEQTPGGLAILAALADGDRRDYLAWRPSKGAKALRAQLAEVEEQGVVFERHQDGRVDLAVAVSAPEGGVATAIVVEGAGPEGGARAQRSLTARARASTRQLEALLEDRPEAARDPFGYLPPAELSPGFDPGANGGPIYS
jgi:IclR family acetate operon transcriptional repressor